VKLSFAEMKDPVKDKLKRFGLFEQFGKDFFFPTVGAAVNSYRLSQMANQRDRGNPE
jgi:hypothetical protein